MNPLKPMKSTALPTILAAGIMASVAQFASAATTTLAPTGITVRTNALTIGVGNLLDVAGSVPSLTNPNVFNASDNAIVLQAPSAGVQATNIASVYGWVKTGYGAADWLGTTGITSAVAIADAQINGVLSVMLYDNTQVGFAKFGTAVNLDTVPDTNLNQVLLRLTYAGDYDADGKVNGADYALLDYYFGAGLTAQGDLNADNAINGGDYAVVDYVFGTQVYGTLKNSTAFAPFNSATAVVPEPASGVLLLFGSVCLAGLRRRK